MNRIIKLGCIASGMLTMLVSCQKENISSQEKGIVNISIRAIQDDETKTSLTAEGVKWNASGEKLCVIEKAGSNDPKSYTSSNGVTNDGGATMTFGVSLSSSSESTYNYYALYPSSSNNGFSSDKTQLKVELSSTQTPSATSFDGTNDILIAKAITGLDTQPTELDFAFKRMIAVGKMKISNLNSTENVRKVSFKATGKILSGRSYLNFNTGKADQYGYYNPQDNVVLDYSKETIAANGMTAYFCVWPFSVAENEEISVTVTTDSKVFTKVINSPRALTFTEGKITSFTVDFKGIVGADNAKSYPFAQEFNGTKGDFTIEDITIPSGMSYVWATNANYIKATAFYNSTKYAAESYLISPVIDMTGASNPVLKFFNAARYGTDNSNQLTLWLREKDGAWEQKEFSNYGDGSSWTMVSNTIDVSAYKGKTLQFAFKYTSSTASAPTWEIQKVYVDQAPTLSSIAWSGYTTSYSVGDTFKKDGKVLATYSDGDVIDVTAEADFSDPVMSSAGDKVVTVSYGGKSTTGTITVNAAGEPIVLYTLDTTGELQGTNNTYDGNCDIKSGEITWNFTGNSKKNPWRIGGKSIENTYREVYTKTAFSKALNSVDVTFGTASSITVNSCKIVYSTNADFSDSKEVSVEFAADSTVKFAADYPANCYYKLVLNVTVSDTKSNRFVQLKKIEFVGLN